MGRLRFTPLLTPLTATWLGAAFLLWAYGIRSLLLLMEGRFDQMAQVSTLDLDARLWLDVTGIIVAGVSFILAGGWLAVRLDYPRPLRSPLLARWTPRGAIPGLAAIMIAISLFMLWRGIGITIETNFDPLPLRLAGALFYARLLIFPLLLAWITYRASGNWRFVAVLVVLSEAVVASASSGSRFVAVLHATPLLFVQFPLFTRWAVFSLGLFANINAASRARNLIIPQLREFASSASAASSTASAPLTNFTETYANPSAIAASTDLTSLHTLPLDYLLVRTQGLPELMMLASRRQLCPTFNDSLKSFIGMVNTPPPNSCASIRAVYGMPESATGGFGLDPMGTLWMGAGGHPILFGLLCILVGIILGLGIALGAWLQHVLQIPYFSYLYFSIIALLVIDGRIRVAGFTLAFTASARLALWAVQLAKSRDLKSRGGAATPVVEAQVEPAKLPRFGAQRELGADGGPPVTSHEMPDQRTPGKSPGTHGSRAAEKGT